MALSGVAAPSGSAPERPAQPEPAAAARLPRREPATEPARAPSVLRCVPIAFAATCVVIVVPALAAVAIVPREGILSAVGSAALAIVGSLALASAGAAVWKRQPRSRDVVFAELMLWGWARRWWTERRIAKELELLDAGRRAGPDVDVERLIALSRLIESRDAHLHGHSRRVARHAVRTARKLGLSPHEVARIRTAAEVHDVGKLYTPRAILNNPGSLTYGELALIRLHATDGARMAGAVGGPRIAAIVRHHHERVDGGGYPDGLAGSAIPLGARIIAVADTFDAITSDRAWRPARSQKRALEVLSAEAGEKLDASVVLAFRQAYSARRTVGWTAFGAVAAQRVAEALGTAASNVGVGFGSVGNLAPALGAAGVLALSPGLFRDSRAPSPASTGATALGAAPAASASVTTTGQAPAGASSPRSPSAASGTRPTRTLRPVDGRGGTPSFQTTPGATSTPTPSAGAPSPAQTSAPGGAAGSSSSSSSDGSSPPSGPQQPGAGAPGGPTQPIAPVTTPSASPPTVGAPSVSTPAVSTPNVTTPSVKTPSASTPSVSVAGVTVPSVTVPSMTVPSVTVPSITIPGVTVPSITLGGSAGH